MSRAVLYVNTPTYTGGAEISLLTLMRHLDPERYRPLILTSNEGQLTQAALGAGIETITQEFPWFRKRYPWRYPASIARLASVMRLRRIALVHTNCDRSLRYVMYSARLAGIPYVSHVRDFVRKWFESSNLIALRHASRVIANSHAVAEACIDAGISPRRVVVIYNPVDLSQFERGPDDGRSELRAEWRIPPEAIVIGIVGQVQPLKGHAEFVTAGLQVAAQVPAARFVIVGSTPPGAENRCFLDDLQQRIENSGLAERFHFAGFRDDIARVMRTIDILTVPSWTEPFGRVAVEGMAAGCAVVATKAGGLVEVIHANRNGLLVPPKDADALQAAITRLIEDPHLRQQLSDVGPAYAKRYSAEKQAGKIQDLYDEVLPTTQHGRSRKLNGNT